MTTYQLVGGRWILPGQHSIVITSPGNRTVKPSKNITINVRAVDYGATSPTLTWAATGLPAGLSIAPTGDTTTAAITGTTPSSTSTSTVTLTATDGQGYYDTEVFVLTVSNAANTVTVTPQANRNTKPLTTIGGFTATAVDSDTTITSFTWTDVVAGSHTLPPGLSINPTTGQVSGTTTGNAGTYTVRLTASDGAGGTGSVTFTWNVGATVPARFPGDPGIGGFLYGCNNGQDPITVNDGRVFGLDAHGKPLAIHTAVREYHNDKATSFAFTPTEKSNLTKWVNVDKRVPFFSWKTNPYSLATLGSVAQGTASTADTNAVNADIDAAAAFVKTLTGPIVCAPWHEPNNDFSDDASCNNFRTFIRYQIGRFNMAGVTNVCWVSSWFTSDLFTNPQKADTWQKWHANWDGIYLPNGQPRWDFNVYHGDGLDLYDPSPVNLNPHPENARNVPFNTKIAGFLQQRIRSGAAQLPFCVGEYGTYTYLPSLKSNGVTVAQIYADTMTYGAGQDNFFGACQWTNSKGGLDSTNDPGGERATALRNAYAMLPIVGATTP